MIARCRCSRGVRGSRRNVRRVVPRRRAEDATRSLGLACANVQSFVLRLLVEKMFEFEKVGLAGVGVENEPTSHQPFVCTA